MKRTQLAQKLLLATKKERFLSSFLVGFDGFTDEIVAAVNTRSSPTAYVPMETIAQFAARIQEASGKSCNIELFSQKTKLGGNGPILAQALTQAGFEPSIIGCLGYPDIEPLFLPLTKKCKTVISLAPSGHTDAIEFLDGKLMLGKHTSVLGLNKELLQSKVDFGTLKRLFDESEVFVSVNWTMIPAMTEIWQWLLQEILPSMRSRERILFVDLADPAKRSDSELLLAINTLKDMQAYYRVHLGLNEKESERVLQLFQQQTSRSQSAKKNIQSCAEAIQKHTKLDRVIIHATKMAACSSSEEISYADGPFCKTPYLSTGGGDNFNAGYLLGLSLNVSQEECLLLGKASSGYYVRAGKSPSLQELAQFLRAWDRDPAELEELIPSAS